jgi:hypothetical protein
MFSSIKLSSVWQTIGMQRDNENTSLSGYNYYLKTLEMPNNKYFYLN